VKSAPSHPARVIAREDTSESICYEILDVLGEGGSGITYRARNSQSQELVALKALSLQRSDDWKSIELFEREANILAQLNHPAIPKYIDYFTVDTATDRHFYIVQTLALGQTLDRLLASGWRATEAEIKDIATQVLDILIYLHNLPDPVIHRDLKPSNILRTPAGEIYLVDFGAVGQAYHNTFLRGSTVVGTFGYMAPEQFRAQAVPATDLYGLGATLLNLLTNRCPADLTQADLQLKFRDRVQISDAFADWLERTLEPDLVDRFDSAQTARQQLKSPKRRTKTSPISWRKIAAFGISVVICLGAIDYYKFYFLSLWGFTPRDAFTAIWQQRDVNKVKSYLDRGVSANAKDANGSSLLHYAVTNNRVDIAKLLMARGADVNAIYGKDEHTVLHLAVLHQDGEMTKALLEGKADPNSRDVYEYTPLHAAILRENKRGYNNSYYGMSDVNNKFSIASVQTLISYGADVNAVGGFSMGKFDPSLPLPCTPLTLIINYNNRSSKKYQSLEKAVILIQNSDGKHGYCFSNECYLQGVNRGSLSSLSKDYSADKVTRTGKHQFKVEKMR
jgi:serine/threonine protein kinase